MWIRMAWFSPCLIEDDKGNRHLDAPLQLVMSHNMARAGQLREKVKPQDCSRWLRSPKNLP
jgi:hypothetical protein